MVSMGATGGAAPNNPAKLVGLKRPPTVANRIQRGRRSGNGRVHRSRLRPRVCSDGTGGSLCCATPIRLGTGWIGSGWIFARISPVSSINGFDAQQEFPENRSSPGCPVRCISARIHPAVEEGARTVNSPREGRACTDPHPDREGPRFGSHRRPPGRVRSGARGSKRFFHRGPL